MNEFLAAGKYYLGDPCNVLHEKIFIGIYGNEYNYANGKFNINGTDFAVHNTHNGDGIFKDTKNRSYNIHTGLIALINLSIIDDLELCKKNGHVFEFKQRINFIYDAGLFYIKSGKKYIHIDTINKEEYNSDMEEHCHNEDGDYISKTLLGDLDDDFIEPSELYINDEEEEEIIEKSNQLFQFFKK